MYFARRSLLPLLLISVLLASCGGQAASEPTPDVNGTVEAGAQTMVAAVFQTQTAAAPTATDTPTPSPTATTGPTNTALALPSLATATQGVVVFFASPTPTGTFYTSTPSSSSLAVGCNNLRLLRSFTEPEGPFKPGQTFTQNWQVENNGTCDWVYVYELVFTSGDRMSGSNRRLSKVIPPNKWTTLSVQLEAPNGTGTHTASWRFTNGSGTGFGSTLPVSIKVEKSSYP